MQPQPPSAENHCGSSPVDASGRRCPGAGGGRLPRGCYQRDARASPRPPGPPAQSLWEPLLECFSQKPLHVAGGHSRVLYGSSKSYALKKKIILVRVQNQMSPCKRLLKDLDARISCGVVFFFWQNHVFGENLPYICSRKCQKPELTLNYGYEPSVFPPHSRWPPVAPKDSI